MANTWDELASAPRKSDEDYTVGWISALPREQATVFLDKKHAMLPTSRRKTPTYMLGEIAGHNTVLAVLPGPGKTEASKCVAQLEANFPNLRFILLVGIAGGAPSSKNDVRLGDIVVSKPGKRDTGVLAYDFGTKLQEQDTLKLFSTKTGLPDAILLEAATLLDTADKQSREDAALGKRLLKYTEQIAERYPQLKNCRRPEGDLLFKTEYEHSNPNRPNDGEDEDCKTIECDMTQLQELPPRKPSGVPKIFHGLIGSGDEVMRNARERDRLAKEYGILCFEMEAAGLSTQTGWLVIRGICDYCDSHKDKRWQDHAALLAAAYGREILAKIPPLETREEQRRKYGAINQIQNNWGNVTVTGGNAQFGGNHSGSNSTFNFFG